MGYYSLYRIIKDIVRTIFGSKFWRKFLIIIIIALGVWFFLHSKGYAVEETEDINYKIYSYYDNVVNDFILRSVNNLSNLTDDPNFGTNLFVYFYYGNVDGSSYNNGQPINKTKLYYFTWSKNYNFNATPTIYDYLGNINFPISVLNNRQVFSLDQNGNRVNEGTHNVYVPLNLLTYENSNLMELLWALKVNDTQAIIDLLEDIKAEQQTTNDILTDSSIDNSVINDLNSGYTAQSENITNNDITFQTGEQKETAWLSQLQSSFTGLSYRLPSNIDLTLPFVNKNLRISSNVFSRFIVGTQIETIIVAFWWVFFGMRIYRLVKRIVIHFASGQIFSAEANQSGPWKMHELLQYEIDRVGLDTFI